MKEKRKVLKKLIGAAAVIFMMTLAFSMSAAAATKTENISAGKQVNNKDNDDSTIHCYKVSLKTSGMIEVMATGWSDYGYSKYVTVDLCNSKGKVLASPMLINGYSMKYALNKGTYLLKIQTPSAYSLKYNFTSYKEKSGSKQSKSVSLKKKKWVSGVVGLGESKNKADYYKVVLKKSAKIYLDVRAETSSYLEIAMTPSKSIKNFSHKTSKTYISSGKGTITYQTDRKTKLPKGTYYIKISRYTKNSSVYGAYQLRWKK